MDDRDYWHGVSVFLEDFDNLPNRCPICRGQRSRAICEIEAGIKTMRTNIKRILADQYGIDIRCMLNNFLYSDDYGGMADCSLLPPKLRNLVFANVDKEICKKIWNVGHHYVLYSC